MMVSAQQVYSSESTLNFPRSMSRDNHTLLPRYKQPKYLLKTVTPELPSETPRNAYSQEAFDIDNKQMMRPLQDKTDLFFRPSNEKRQQIPRDHKRQRLSKAVEQHIDQDTPRNENRNKAVNMSRSYDVYGGESSLVDFNSSSFTIDTAYKGLSRHRNHSMQFKQASCIIIGGDLPARQPPSTQ